MFKKLVLSIICSFTLLAGCSNSDANVESKTITVKMLQETLSNEFEGELETVDQTTVEHLLNLDSNNIQNAVECFDSKQPELLFIIVESNDESLALSTSESLQNYLDSLKQQATMYDADQLALIQDGYITTNGKFSILVISNNINNVKKTLMSCLH